MPSKTLQLLLFVVVLFLLILVGKVVNDWRVGIETDLANVKAVQVEQLQKQVAPTLVPVTPTVSVTPTPTRKLLPTSKPVTSATESAQ